MQDTVTMVVAMDPAGSVGVCCALDSTVLNSGLEGVETTSLAELELSEA